MTDEEQIKQLIVGWMDANDRKDVEEFSASFTEDGSFETNWGVATGHEALKEQLKHRNEINPPDRVTLHLNGQGIVKVDGNTAEAMVPYVSYGRIGASPWGITTIGRIHAKLVQRDSRWYIAYLVEIPIGPPGWPAGILHAPESERHVPSLANFSRQ